MKKLTVVALMATMMLTFAACGNDATDNTNEQPKTQEEQNNDDASDVNEEDNADTDADTDTEQDDVDADENEDGEGEGANDVAEKNITIAVVDADAVETDFAVTTDAEFLFDAIEDCEEVTLDGYESDYGYYITGVNGVTADYDADGAYWAIYVNDDYGMYGVDTQPVTDGDTYKLVYEVYTATEE